MASYYYRMQENCFCASTTWPYHISCRSVTYRYEKGELQVLILYRGTAFNVHPDSWSLAGGTLRNNETLEDCVRRETLEETGYKVEPLVYIGSTCRNFFEAASKRSFDKTTHYFLCKLTSDKQGVMDSEHEHLEWLTPNEAMKRLNARLPEHHEGDMIERGIEWLYNQDE